MIKHQLEVRVSDKDGKALADASITATPEALGTPAGASFDSNNEQYFLNDLRPGFFEIRVEHVDYVTQTRRIQVHQKPQKISFIMGASGDKFTYQGNVRIPYLSPPDLIGIIPGAESADQVDSPGSPINNLLASLGLNPVKPATDEDVVSDQDDDGPEENISSIPGSVIVQRTAGAVDANDSIELKTLRESPLVAAAGPIFRRSGAAFSVFTNRLFVRFLPEVSKKEAEDIVKLEGLSIVQLMGFSPNLYLVEADTAIGEAVNQIAENLVNTQRVIYAEPVLAEVPELDAITPTDFLWPGIWDRQLVNADDAWQRLNDDPATGPLNKYGRPEIIIAVIDQGIKSVAGVPENADFQGIVSDGSSKTYQLYNFSSMVPNNDAPFGNHGVGCAGVATSIADNPSTDPAVGIGLAGAAPNSRLIGLIYNGLYDTNLPMFIWAAGLNFPTTDPAFPAPITPGTDIFTCSIAFGRNNPLSGAAQDMFDYITSRGRNGKGCMAFFSAGNANSNIENYRPYGAYERSFSCAASTLDATESEIRAPYSGWGVVEWCAPSNRASTPHNPPINYRTWGASFNGQGNLPASPDFQTTLSTDSTVAFSTMVTIFANAGDTTINVADSSGFAVGQWVRMRGNLHSSYGEWVQITNIPGPTQLDITALTNNHAIGREVLATITVTVGDTSGFAANQWILLEDPGAVGSEVVMVRDIVSATDMEISSPANAHATGAPLYGGQNDYRNSFGGTSSATPLSAGIAALVLSARPELTWVEAREILRNTAVKLDLDNTNPTGQWLDVNGDPVSVSLLPPIFSQWYGYGRLDADAAVAAALSYTFPRDLVIRDDLLDNGLTANAPSADSPDIWMRNMDPAIDPGALPATYAVVGPHEDPIYGGPRWIYARIRNIGAVTSLDAWARFYVASHTGVPFVHPADWEAENGLGNTAPASWQAGTYFIGEVALPTVAAGADIVVNIPWPDELFPPPLTPTATSWNPYLLVEVTPHDGPLTGELVEENNNLAQKAITFIDLIAPVVEFLDGSGNPMPYSVPIPSTIPNIDFPLEIVITDQGFFESDTVTFSITWHFRSGAPTIIDYVYDGAAWSPSAVPPSTVTINNPVDGGGDPVSGQILEAIFNGNIALTGEFRQIQVLVNVSDLSGNTTPAVEASRLLEVMIPTDIAMVLDYSGSMLHEYPLGHTKWQSASEAANLFNAIYAALSSTITLDNRIALIRFFTDGMTGPDLTEVTENLAPPSTAVPLVDDPPPATTAYWTPMGSGLLAAHGELAPAAPDWRSRVMILLTDGKENRDPRLADIRVITDDTDPLHIPTITENAQTGYRIHSCAFGGPGQVDTADIQYLSLGGDGLKSYDGQLHSTESSANPDEAFALKEHFLSLLADILPVEIIGPIPANLVLPISTAFMVEPGISELVCIVTDNVAFTVTAPPEHTDPIGAVNIMPGFSWVHISNPAPGEWSLSGFAPSDTVKGFAVVDLTLNATFDAAKTGIAVNQPIPLWAEITENGTPVSGATVTVEVEGPGESVSEVLMNYVQPPQVFKSILSLQNIYSKKLEPVNIRRELLLQAIKDRGYGFKLQTNRITLQESSTPGRYEGVWFNTSNEGTYTFRFKATGSTATGHGFERNYIASRHIELQPDTGSTTFHWIPIPLVLEKKVLWKGIIQPKSVTGKLLGPGFADKLRLAYAGSQITSTKGTKKKPVQRDQITIVDNLDGTYKVELELPKGQTPPVYKLQFGNRTFPLLVKAPPCRHVRVVLNKIQVLDDKETWFPSPGEMAFDFVVAPNSDPDRLMRRRIPSQGHIKLKDRETKDFDETVFDGYLEEGSILDISAGGTEFDWLLFFTKRDPMARYRRRFTGPISSWEGSYKPDDETDDPESLADWKLWYTIEVT